MESRSEEISREEIGKKAFSGITQFGQFNGTNNINSQSIKFILTEELISQNKLNKTQAYLEKLNVKIAKCILFERDVRAYELHMSQIQELIENIFDQLKLSLDGFYQNNKDNYLGAATIEIMKEMNSLRQQIKEDMTDKIFSNENARKIYDSRFDDMVVFCNKLSRNREDNILMKEITTIYRQVKETYIRAALENKNKITII